MDDKNESIGVGVRKMDLNDLDDVLVIENNCFSSPWQMQAFEESIKQLHSYILYYLSSNEIVGYFIGYGDTDDYSIYNIAIKTNYQRRGFATHLLNVIMRSHKKKYENYYLEVRKSNIKAINLYYKLGFKTAYTRCRYYTKPDEDALVMKFTIKNRMGS